MQAAFTPSAVVLLCDYAAPYAGNFIPSLTALCDALQKKGVPSVLILPRKAETLGWCALLRAEGRDVRFLSGNGFFAELRLLGGVLREKKNAILHVHFGFFPLARALCLLHRRVRLVLHYHSDFSAGRKPTRTRRIKRALNKVFDALIGEKRITRISVSDFSGVREDGCISIHNALVDKGRFCVDSKTGVSFRCDDVTTQGDACLRESLRVKDDETLVMLFCWSPYVKGADVAARAMKRLNDAGETRFLLALVGGATCNEDQLRAFLQKNTPLTGGEPYLRCLPPTENVFSYYAAADIFLSASRSETFSYALSEALYAGCVCVSSNIDGVQWARRYLAPDGFYPVEDDAALADALIKAERRAKDGEREKRVAETRSRILNEYAIDDWVDAILGVYKI